MSQVVDSGHREAGVVWCGDTGRRDTAGDTGSQPEAECPCPGDTAAQRENMCPCSAADTVDQWEDGRTPDKLNRGANHIDSTLHLHFIQ